MTTLEHRRAGVLRRPIRNALVPAAVLLVALAALFPGAAAAQPSTTISAEIGGSILGNGFTPDSTATVRIFEGPGGALLYTGTSATADGWFELERDTHGQELAAGMAVTATDDATGVVKELTLVAVTFDYLNPTTDVASGTAPPGSTVTVRAEAPGEWVELETLADATGDWLADFGAAGLDIGLQGAAGVRDGDGDETQVYRPAPHVSVSHDYGFGRENLGLGGAYFTPGATVEAKIFAPDGALLWSGNLPTDETGRFGHCCVVPELVDVEVVPGMHVVVTDPVTTIAKAVTLVPFTVDEVDPVADTVEGTAPPGARVQVTEWNDRFFEEIAAGPDGRWLLDLGAAGVDVTWLEGIEAWMHDEDGDMVGASGSPATFRVELAADVISGDWFALGGALDIEILDSTGGVLWAGAVPTAYRAFAVGPDVHGVDFEPGMVVRVADPIGGFTKEVTIVPLSITVLDPARDFAAGTAAPNSSITLGIWFPGEGGGQVSENVPVGPDGVWTFDFAGGEWPADIEDDTVLTAAVPDAEWDSTSFELTATPGAIANLEDDVADLLASGDLTAVQAAQLENKLEDALGKLADGKVAAAIDKLEAFVEKVESLVSSGKLAPAAGERLVERAAAIAAALRA